LHIICSVVQAWQQLQVERRFKMANTEHNNFLKLNIKQNFLRTRSFQAAWEHLHLQHLAILRYTNNFNNNNNNNNNATCNSLLPLQLTKIHRLNLHLHDCGCTLSQTDGLSKSDDDVYKIQNRILIHYTTCRILQKRAMSKQTKSS